MAVIWRSGPHVHGGSGCNIVNACLGLAWNGLNAVVTAVSVTLWDGNNWLANPHLPHLFLGSYFADQLPIRIRLIKPHQVPCCGVSPAKLLLRGNPNTQTNKWGPCTVRVLHCCNQIINTRVHIKIIWEVVWPRTKTDECLASELQNSWLLPGEKIPSL